MGKKKNKNKVSGAVKTAAKTEKKLAQKLKKELANLGEEDIAKVIAEIEREEAKRAAATEHILSDPPSARAYASLTPHPISNELILFGGEYHDGQKTVVYNELLFYNPSNNVWRQIKAPGPPPPRSAHQAVATPANKGELWIFGGEFTSPSETQFHHYKDLWCFSFADKKWEKVAVPGGPSPRSGHRAVLLGRRLLVFGGYADDGRDCRYFDDVHAFCLDTRTWSKIEPTGRAPAPRSACLMLPINNDSLLVYGGFSRTREGRTERALTHGDMWKLSCKNGSWAWRAVPGGGAYAPLPRAGLAAALAPPHAKAYVFGGVSDVEETEEELRGELSDSLQLLDVEAARWHQVTLADQRPVNPSPQTKITSEEKTPESNIKPVTVVTDEVFTMQLGGASAPTVSSGEVLKLDGGDGTPRTGPGPRMSAMMAVQRSVLYVYGGVLEKDDKQFYLSDMYSLDLHKLSEWRTLIQQPPLPAWLGSDSEADSDTDTADSDSGSESE
ncbi:Kelch domain-containing protein 4 [Eumeta japonica]|uniref:Kelch domain-containing protein 4 n=1 Tax=Eumeta variegata TaxID=151549 RepID=A0A4C1TEV4_EUMVA|nr:Kelch domain-containing protein 4 [Eumeta japonica]